MSDVGMLEQSISLSQSHPTYNIIYLTQDIGLVSEYDRIIGKVALGAFMASA